MANTPKQPYVYEGLDPANDKSPAEQVTETVKQAASRAGDMFESAKQPGMPLSIVANMAREAPLGTVFAAFIVGYMFGRR
jgi:hypothetical protein